MADSSAIDNEFPLRPPPYEAESPPPRARLVAFEDIKLTRERRYLVKGLIPRTGLTVIWGAPKSGKSFWCFDVMMHVALGWEYRGRRVQSGPVVYCAFEGQSGIRARVEAFRLEKMSGAEVPDHVPFYLQDVTLDLVADHGGLIEVVRQQLGDHPPAVVVLDTLNRSLRGSESSDQDMSAYVQAADAIREAFECAVIVVHHCGHNGERPRGHSSLAGALDAQLSVKRAANDAIVVECELNKDGPTGDTVTSRLEVVTVDHDEDGEEITSCVIVEEDEAPVPSSGPKLSKNQATMFSILHDAGSQGLTKEEWNEQAREAGLGVKRRPDLLDFRSALQSKGLVVEGMDGRWRVNH